MSFHPVSEPAATGSIDAEDGNEIYFETSGDPEGIPALYLHGGPGSGLGSGGYRSLFDPARYRIVGIDQRGCGRSRPWAADALERLASNTTQALIADIEAVRRKLGIEAFVVCGVSWGSTLALAYAQSHPDRVRALILVAVTTTSRREVDWITEGIGCIFPEAFSTFDASSNREPDERIVEAYARRLRQGSRDERLRAAASWIAWEDTIVSLDPGAAPRPFDEAVALNFATIVTHYWANDGFLPGDRAILERMPAIAHLPAVLIHGRRDLGGPSVTPWLLLRKWPASRLCIVETEGHGGPRSMLEARHVLDGFAADLAVR